MDNIYKNVYKFDDQGNYLGYDLVSIDYVPKTDKTETCVTLPTGLNEPLTFDFDKQQWSGASLSDYQKTHPSVIVPTELETQVAALAFQQVVNQQTITSLQTQNAQMAYQLMTKGGATA